MEGCDRVNDLLLSEAMLSRAFWAELDAVEVPAADAVTIIAGSFHQLERFPARTGTVSLASANALWRLARYFQPKTIAEVGTYIGRSTAALRLGAADAFIWTCDAQFDCWQNPWPESVHYAGKTPSTHLFRQLYEKEIPGTDCKANENPIDMFVIDGRLNGELDAKAMVAISQPKTVIICDDFDGVEKGIANVMLLRPYFPHHILLTPPPAKNWSEGHSLAVLVPRESIKMTRQQTLPEEMM